MIPGITEYLGQLLIVNTGTPGRLHSMPDFE